MDDRWLSVDEIADYLGVSRDTVYSWITSRNMPAHRVGRLWKLKKDAVDVWVKSGGADLGSPTGGKVPPVGPHRTTKKPRTSARAGSRR